jgi:NitT/TauT family transport system substrate-binding protein
MAVRLAVEFVDHAACAHIARNQGWYDEAGMEVDAFDNYATGMALSAALAKGGIDAAYMCLFPVINAYANAGVGLKIVAGTHLYGYGLVVNPEKVKNVRDLSSPDVRLGCNREGSPPAALLHRLVEVYDLDPGVVDRARRMPPSKLLLSLISGQIDAAFLPEQFPTMAEAAGFKELVSVRDLWPGMQGSVLVVTDSFLKAQPEAVKKLVHLTERGVSYINEYPDAAARIVAGELNVAGRDIFPSGITGGPEALSITPEVIASSLGRKMVNTCRVDPEAVQQAIDVAARLGYIRKAFRAEEILALGWLDE